MTTIHPIHPEYKPCADHYCLVFETLGISLYDLIKRNDYTGFPLRHVKDLAR
jgi:hypothetical protein